MCSDWNLLYDLQGAGCIWGGVYSANGGMDCNHHLCIPDSCMYDLSGGNLFDDKAEPFEIYEKDCKSRRICGSMQLFGGDITFKYENVYQ